MLSHRCPGSGVTRKQLLLTRFVHERGAADCVTLLFMLAMVSKAGGSLYSWRV